MVHHFVVLVTNHLWTAVKYKNKIWIMQCPCRVQVLVNMQGLGEG